MRKIIFINRYFYPDHSATSQLLSDLAFHLRGGSSETHVITSRQMYDDAKAVLPFDEVVQGVHIHRVWTTRFGRYNNYGRAIDYLSFYLTSMFCLARWAGRGDIVVVKTDPPLIAVPASFITRLKSAYLVNWLQDLFPEVAEKLGIKFIRGWLYWLLKWMRNRSLKSARHNVVIGERMAEYLQGEGIPGESITVIDNWVDNSRVAPVEPGKNRLRREWGLDGKYVVGYSGNLGRAHDFSTMLDAAEILRDDPDIVFLFIGGGVRMDSARKECEKRGLPNVYFKEYQPRERLSESLSSLDVHLISLNPALEGFIVPSKFYSVVAVGKPVIFLGDDDGEIARKIRKYSCGMTVKQGDSAGLVEVIRKLSADQEFSEQLAKNSLAVRSEIGGLGYPLARWKEMFQRIFSLDLSVCDTADDSEIAVRNQGATTSVLREKKS